MKCQQYPLGKNMQVVVLVADQLVFHRTQVRFQQRKIQVTCTFRKVVGFHGDATELLGFHLSNYTSNSYPWHPLWNSTLVLLQGARQSGQSVLMMALCACNPPVVFAKKVALCNAHLWADPGRVIDGHRHSTENRTAELWWPGGIPKALSGVMPPLKSCATSPDSWRPALTSNNNQDRTLLHTAVAEWLTCFIELHRLHGSPKSWVCLALSARSLSPRRLNMLRMLRYGRFENSRVDRTWPKPAVGDSDRFIKTTTFSSHWTPKTSWPWRNKMCIRLGWGHINVLVDIGDEKPSAANASFTYPPAVFFQPKCSQAWDGGHPAMETNFCLCLPTGKPIENLW